MEGRARAAKRRQDENISLAWHTAAFNAATKRKKGLDKLSTYLKPKAVARNQTAADMLEIMREFQSRGSPMKITRVEGRQR